MEKFWFEVWTETEDGTCHVEEAEICVEAPDLDQADATMRQKVQKDQTFYLTGFTR